MLAILFYYSPYSSSFLAKKTIWEEPKSGMSAPCPPVQFKQKTLTKMHPLNNLYLLGMGLNI